MRHHSSVVVLVALTLPAVTALRAPSTVLNRRALLGGVATAAIALPRPASAGLEADLSSAEAALQTATGIDETTAAFTRLRDVVDGYGGMPSQERTEQLVNRMRQKRSALQGDDKKWNGITEEAYNGLMRAADPWRVVELAPRLQGAIYTFPFVYLALLGVQQFKPVSKFFNQAYGVAAALVLGPLLFQILVG